MITNPSQLKLVDSVKYIDDPQEIVRLMQPGASRIPGYALAARGQELLKKENDKKLAAAKMPTTTVMQELASGLRALAPQAPMAQPQMMAQAPMPQGVPQGMAAGGMIPGLAGGRRPEDYGDYPTLSPTYLTDAYAGQPYVEPPEEPLPEGAAADRAALRRAWQKSKEVAGRWGALGADMLTMPARGAIGATNATAIRGLRAAGANVPYLPYGAFGPNSSGFMPMSSSANSAVLPHVNIPNRVYSMGNIGQKPPLRDVDVPPYTDTPEVRVKGQGVGGGGGGTTKGLQGAAAAAGYTPKEPQYGNIEDELKGYPEGTGIKEYIASLKGSDTSAKDRNQAIAMGLMNAGFKTMSTAGPTLSALGTGAQEGLRSFATQDAENRYYKNQLRKELGAASMAEDARQMQRYGIGRQALSDKARTAREYEALRQQAAEAAQRSLDTRYVADQGLRGHQISAGASKEAMIAAQRDRMIQGEYAKAVAEFADANKGNMKYAADPVNGAALLQRDAEQAGIRRVRMIKGSENTFVFPQEEAAPNPYQVFDKPGGKPLGRI